MENVKDFEKQARHLVRGAEEDLLNSRVFDTLNHINPSSTQVERTSLPPWQRVALGGWVANTIWNTLIFGILVVGWVLEIRAGVFADDASGVDVLWGLALIGVTCVGAIVAVTGSLDGKVTKFFRSRFATREGTSEMNHLRWIIEDLVREIDASPTKEMDSSSLKAKLREVRQVARTEGTAYDLLQATIRATGSTQSVERFFKYDYARTEVLNGANESDRRLIEECAATVRECRMEAARLLVALKELATVERRKAEEIAKRKATEKHLAEVERQRSIVDKRRVNIHAPLKIGTTELFEQAQTAQQRILAEKNATVELEARLQD